MDLIKSINKDKTYNKYKLTVKTWEKDFKIKHSRTPSKYDIKDAPTKIRYAYKKYYEIKSAALQNSLLVNETDEEILQIPECSPTFEIESVDRLSPKSEQLLQSLPSGQEIDDLLKNYEESNSSKLSREEEVSTSKLITLHNNIDVNKDITVNDQTLNSFTENLSKKLFHNRTFSLRNPRKLLKSKTNDNCLTNSRDKVSIITNTQQILNKAVDNDKTENEFKVIIKTDEHVINNEVYVDVKTHDIAHQMSKTNRQVLNTEVHNDIMNSNLTFNMSSNLTIIQGNLTNDALEDVSVTLSHNDRKLRQLNDAWFERATGMNVTENVEKPINNTERYGISNIKAITTTEKNNDYIENSESDEENYSIKKIKPALKKRKVSATENIVHCLQITPTSKNENKIRNTTIKGKRNSKLDDTLKEQPYSDFNEYQSFGLDEVIPRHSNLTELLKTKDSLKHDTTTKNGLTDTRNENLKKKISNGCVNDNFVKINIDKKIYVRGKKHINFSTYKKQQWKQKKSHLKMDVSDTNNACYKCGVKGHYARYCTAHKGDNLLPLENSYDDNIPTLQEMQSDKNIIPTLDDMQNIVSNILKVSNKNDLPVDESNTIPDSYIKILAMPRAQETSIKPIYTNYQHESPKELHDVLHMFGHNSFRPGQEQTIMRVLAGMSTLLILSTGGGKSLCYQIPAYIYSQKYKCITLVISPLVSLMEDQVLSMPEFLKAGCLHTNQTPTQRQKIIQYLKDGSINILLISPEALISGESSGGLLGLFKSLPPIAFACIDEVHCVSQWSHNFRPSYLIICRVLREKLNVKCILGLTATASQTTIKSIIRHIEITDGTNGVITNPALPDNLHLSVSIEKNKDKALITYLNSKPIKTFNSIIIYCIRRDECERIAATLRSHLQEPGKISIEINHKKRKRMSYIAEAYHAGMSAAQRKKIQKHFMDGTLKIIVATVAFGMGINKPDIRCIIHYNMPNSYESYVQEVGRAGRDGHMAYCHVFLNNNDSSDKNELLKHIYANSVDRATIRRLIQKVFIPCQCFNFEQGTSNNFRCKGHEVGIPIESTVEELDLPSENIITLLCYVELHPKNYIKVLNNVYIMCKVLSYGGPQKILEAAKTCPPLAMAYVLESKKDPEIINKAVIEFNVIEVAAAIGWESGMIKYHLKNLEWIKSNGISKKSQLKIEFNTLGFRIKAPGDLTPTELDTILDDLYETVQIQEKVMLCQLEECNNAFSKYGHYSLEEDQLSEDVLLQKSNKLKSTIKTYFQREGNHYDVELKERPLDTESIISDIRALICTYKDCKFTGRSIARIFQGISSPNYPAIIWGKCKFWRSHIHEDFYGLVRLGTQQILQNKIM